MPNTRVIPLNTKPTTQLTNMHNSMKIPYIIGACLGVLPIQGLTSPRAEDLCLKWSSPRMAYFLLCLGLGILFAIIGIINTLLVENRIYLVYSFMSRLMYILLCLCLFNLARHLRKLMVLWTETDRALNRTSGYPQGFDARIKRFSMAYLIYSTAIMFANTVTSLQFFKTSEGNIDFFDFFAGHSPFFFSRYSTHSCIAGMISCLLYNHGGYLTFFNDYLLIVYATAISIRFEQITERIGDATECSAEFWREITADYVRLIKLSRKLNKYVSLNVLVSFGSNMFSILTALSFAASNQNKYFYFEFAVGSLSAILVCFYTAWINEASRKSAIRLNFALSSSYDRNVDYRLVQIGFDTVALDGGKLFKCTRQLILNIACAIITYELFLIQLFN